MSRTCFVVVLLLAASSTWAANPQLGFTEMSANQSQPHVVVNAADRSITNAVAGQISINFTSDANLTLTSTQWQYGTIVFTDTAPVLTTSRDVIYPNVDSQTGGTSRMQFVIVNNTGENLTIKRSGQTGVTVNAGASALVRHSGTDIVSVSGGGGGGGTIDLTTDVTGTLPIGNGGTGLSSASDDQAIVSNGTTWQAKTLPDCTDTGGNHLNYTQSTNAFSCGTSGGGGGGSPGGADTQVQYNGSGSFAGDSGFTYSASTNTITLGETGDTGELYGGTSTSGAGPQFTVRAGNSGVSGQNGGKLSLLGGVGSGTATGGSIDLLAGSDDEGGEVLISSGSGGIGNAGTVTIQAQISSSATSGSIALRTGGATRMTLEPDGSLNLGGSNGTAGHIITSAGPSAAPTWAASGGAFSVQTPTTGFSITISDNVNTLILNPSGTLAAGTVTLPATPYTGQIIRITSDETITALTVSPNSGKTISNAPTTMSAGIGHGFIYVATDLNWYRLY